MKKILSILLAGAMLAGCVLTGCSDSSSSKSDSSDGNTAKVTDPIEGVKATASTLSAIQTVTKQATFRELSLSLTTLMTATRIQVTTSVLTQSGLLRLCRQSHIISMMLKIITILIPTSVHSTISTSLLKNVTSVA